MTEKAVIRSAQDLLSARPVRVVAAESEFFGATVHFRELTGAAIDLFLNLELREDGTAEVDAEYLIGSLQQALCDPDGKLLFAGAQGRTQLQAVPWKGLQELFTLFNQALGRTEERVAEKKAD